MLTAVFIALWAYLFCMPLSEPGQVFGWLKKWLYKKLITPYSTLTETWQEMVYMALIGCPKCHAGQVAFWWQIWSITHGGTFDIPFILIAIAGAYALQTWHLIVEKWLHK